MLKQRAASEQQRVEDQQVEQQEAEEAAQEELARMPQLRVASAGQQVATTALELPTAPRADAGATLAEQARMLSPGSFRSGSAPGHTPNLARFGRPRPVAVEADPRDPRHNRRSTDASLQNLEFIGSSAAETVVEMDSVVRSSEPVRPAPAPSLRESPPRQGRNQETAVPRPDAVRLADLEPRAPVFLPPDHTPAVEPPPERLRPLPLDRDRVRPTEPSVIDLDSAPPPSLAPIVQRAEEEFERSGFIDPAYRKATPKAPEEEGFPVGGSFSSSLMTSKDLGDR
ncbi:MAG: hypothetical protein R3E50_01850 [Halioglobus sp.]